MNYIDKTNTKNSYDIDEMNNTQEKKLINNTLIEVKILNYYPSSKLLLNKTQHN